MAKKKTNRQSEDHKPPKSQHEIPRQTIDDDASEKLDSLKSLNAMLLKETVERRHQVDSLTQINGSLESEFSRCKSDNVTLQSELSGFTERALMFEIEKGLVSRFVAVQVNEMAEVSRGERVSMEEKIGSLEREMSRVLEEKNATEKAKNKKESEVTSLNSRLDSLVTQIGEEKLAFSKVCAERDGIRAQLDYQIQFEKGLRLKLAEAEMRETEISEKSQKIKVDYDDFVKEKKLVEQKVDLILKEKDSFEMSLVDSKQLIDELHLSVHRLNELVSNLREGEKQLHMKVADFEKKCIVDSEKQTVMSMEIDALVKELQESMVSIQNLIQEKSLVSKDLNEALKMIEHQKLTINQMVEEKTKIEEQSGKFKNTIVTIEKSNRVQIDKIKQLESEISHHKAETVKSQANLNEEKLKLKNWTEKISKMEKGIEETRKKLSKMTTNSEKLVAEKSDLAKLIAETRKEHDDTKAKLRSSEAKTNRIVKIFKTTNSICNQETESGDDIKDYGAQVEAIKKAFKEKESVVEELKKQLDSLKVFAEKANDGKNFWTKVSSATTIFAALSLAFIARGY